MKKPSRKRQTDEVAIVLKEDIFPHIQWRNVDLPMPGLDQDHIDADIKAAGENGIALMEIFGSKIREYHANMAKMIREDGHRIFHVISENDDYSVEADYGAPSVGLDFAHQLIDFKNSYRYPRIRTVEGGYKTFEKSAMKVGAFLKKQGYGVFDGLEPEQYPSHIMYVNGGVTKAFNLLMCHLIDLHGVLNDKRKQFDSAKKGAILVPVPTYGLFLYALHDIIDDRDIEIIPVRRHESGAVIQQSLQNALDDCDARDVKVIAYYDCNPNNPTGHIRDEAETRAVAEIIQAHNRKNMEKLDNLYEVHKENRAFTRYSMHVMHPGFGIVMVDDMAYEGLEYDPRNKPFSFSQVSPEIAAQSVTLKGISKIGLPGARIGMMIASHEIIGSLSEPQLISEFCASAMGVDIITSRYSDNEHQRLFSRHKSRLRQKHKHNGAFLEALFQGFRENRSLSPAEKDKVVRKYAQHKNISQEEAGAILDKGLPNFYMYPDTQCGFFKLANFDSLRSKELYFYKGDNFRVFGQHIRTGSGMWNVLKGFGIDVVPLSWAGAGSHCMDARISLSLKDDEIFTMYDRLREMHDYFFGVNPEVQLDYLRMPSLSL